VGGTFIDIVAADESGNVRATKVPTRPRLFAGLKEGLDDLHVDLEEVELLVHGTTVATNALIEKTGARTLLVMTRGFRDILEIRRTDKGDLFNLNWSPPHPIVERADRLEIDERVLWTGEEIKPLDAPDVERLVRIADKRHVEAIAVVFLHSYVNPLHEQQLRDEIAARRPDIHVSISSDIVPAYREFERTATTAANAYIAPVVARYLDMLDADLRSAGFAHQILIMQSNGAVIPLEGCKRVPAKTVRSGPAGGTVALAAEARRVGRPHMIGLDIGGTTADVSMVWEAEPKWRPQLTVEFGLPIQFPTIDIVSIGAGGGTIAWIDPGGALRAGPMSAGATPGPACYGTGGEHPTGTDAQLILNRLGAGNFLGGRMTVYPELGRKAIAELIAEPLGLDTAEAAAGIVAILTHNMIQAVRLVTIERGFDPRDFALCAFGGGGALYAADIAYDLNMPVVVVPERPGVLSALGMLLADMGNDASQSVLARVADLRLADVDRVYKELEERVLTPFLHEGIGRAQVLLQRYADLLYSGQTHTLSVPILSDGQFDSRQRDSMLETFHADHERRFGHADPALPVEFVNLRVFARHTLTAPEGLIKMGSDTESGRLTETESGRLTEKERRDVYFSQASGFVDTPVYGRSDLPAGVRVLGPAVIEQMDTTTVVPPGMVLESDPATRSLLIHTRPEGAAA
jgi:N-methylhydantoinase A